MADYLVEVKPSARKEIFELPDSVLGRVVKAIDSLASEPHPNGCRKLRGYKDKWRIRVGDWRVVYIVDDAARLVSVTRVAHRRDVYNR